MAAAGVTCTPSGDQEEIAAALRGFDGSATIGLAVNDLVELGLVERTQDRLQLTPKDAETHRELGSRVERVRQRVAAALPRGDYVALVHLLARLVRSFTDETRSL